MQSHKNISANKLTFHPVKQTTACLPTGNDSTLRNYGWFWQGTQTCIIISTLRQAT